MEKEINKDDEVTLTDIRRWFEARGYRWNDIRCQITGGGSMSFHPRRSDFPRVVVRFPRAKVIEVFEVETDPTYDHVGHQWRRSEKEGGR